LTFSSGSFPFLLLSIPLLLPSLAFSRGSFMLLSLALEPCKRSLSPGVSLVGSKLVETRSLALILRQATTALLVEEPEIVLRTCVFALAGGDLIKARGLALVLEEATTALLVEDTETALSAGVPLGCRPAIPRQRRCIVPRDALASLV
jgi:hypothetical protein